jgi:hypothetical protein
MLYFLNQFTHVVHWRHSRTPPNMATEGRWRPIKVCTSRYPHAFPSWHDIYWTSTSHQSAGSSVSISDYGFDDRAIEVRSPAEAKDIPSSLCVQTGSGAHPASCTMGTGGSFPRGNALPGRDADRSPPSSAEVKNEQELNLVCSQASPWRVAGLLCFWSVSRPALGSTQSPVQWVPEILSPGVKRCQGVTLTAHPL